MLHLLGDEDNAIVLKRKQANIGLDALLRESTIQAVIGNTLLSSVLPWLIMYPLCRSCDGDFRTETKDNAPVV